MKYSSSRADLLPALLYFFYFAAAGSLSPFLNVFFQVKGMSMSQISILAALPMGLTLIAAPIWAGIADYFNLHRKILPLIIFLTLPFTALIGTFNSFMVLLPAVFCYSFAFSPIMSLSDNAVILYLGERRYDYGKVRLWGSIGWGLLGWLIGILMEHFGMSIAFVSYIVFMALDGWIALKLPEPEIEQGDPYWANIRKVAKDVRWYGFLAASFLAGTAFMFFSNYFFIFLKDLGAPSSIQGLSLAASVIFELPFFIFSASLIRKISSRGLIKFAFVALIARLVLCSLLKDPIWGVAIQLLHGPFYSTYWTGAVNYASEIAPRGLGASAQALFAASFFGLGGIAGALLGGYLYAQFSPQVMFLSGAGFTLIGLILFNLLGKREIILQRL